MDIMAAGIDADTVVPIFKARYPFATAKKKPNIIPKIVALKENSLILLLEEIWGSNGFSDIVST